MAEEVIQVICNNCGRQNSAGAGIYMRDIKCCDSPKQRVLVIRNDGAKGTMDYSVFHSLKNAGIIKKNENGDFIFDIVEDTIENPKGQIAKASKIFSLKNQAEKFNQIQPIFYDKNCIWWLWDHEQFKWSIVDEVDILNMIEQETGKDVINSKSRAEILNALKQKGRKNIPKPPKPYWIQFKDTIVDIRTGDEIKATPEYFVTNPIPHDIHPEHYVQTPKIDKLFNDWVGKDNAKMLYQIIAYCLVPDYPIHRLFCLLGSGLNGKSCFLRLLTKFVGVENTTSTELENLLNSRFEIAKLHKKLVCIMGETNFSEISKTSILKKLTGQDPIGFEYKNKNPFDNVNYAKILIATNNLPATTDKTIGFYRRWTIIDFPNQFSEEKEVLSQIQEEEFQALAVKCILILMDLLSERKFHNEGGLKERMERYEAKSDFLQNFLNDHVDCSDMALEKFITKADFFKKFSEWCVENRHRKPSERSLTQKLREKGIDEGKKHFSWIHDGRGGDARVWLSISWK